MSTSFQSCPGCDSFILADTYECPECSHVFDEERAKAAAGLTKDLESQSMYDTCRKCGESVRSGLVRCWNCNTFMRKDVEARYEEMKSSPQQIIFSDVPKENRTELIDARTGEAQRGTVYDAQDDGDFDFTLRSDDGGDGGFELSSPSAPPPPTAPAAPVVKSTAPQPAEAATAAAAAEPAVGDTAAETPTAAAADSDARTADDSKAEAPAAEKKSPDDFDVSDLVGIAMQDQKETRKRKKKKVEEARSKRILMPCTRCGAWIRVHQEQGGRTLRCRQCKFHSLCRR